MSNKVTINGSCLCGAVTLSAKNVSPQTGACHCSFCRKWGGGPFMSTSGIEGVHFTGEDKIQVFDSSDWAQRGFCKQCGTHLFYQLKQNGQHFIPIGLLDEQDQWELNHQVFIDEKPAYYCFANKTHELTGQQVFEAFGADQ